MYGKKPFKESLAVDNDEKSGIPGREAQFVLDVRDRGVVSSEEVLLLVWKTEWVYRVSVRKRLEERQYKNEHRSMGQPPLQLSLD